MKAIIIATVVALATVGAPVPTTATAPSSAAAADPHRVTTLTAGPVAFQRGDHSYRLTIRATDAAQDTDSIRMTIRRTRDPDGDGPAISRQAHVRLFEAPDTVSSEPDLAHAAISTDDKLAPHGEVNVEFTPTAPAQEAPCAGGKRTVRKGRIDGNIRFVSGTRFGDVVFTSMRARLDLVEEGACAPPASPVPQGCQRPGWGLFAHDGDLHVTAFEGRRGLVVTAGRATGLRTRDPATDGYLMERTVTRLPVGHARFASDLTSATVRGMRGTDVHRRATFSASSRVHRDVSNCYDATRETVERRRRGALGGTMRLTFFIGADERLADRELRGDVMRRRNRPRG